MATAVVDTLLASAEPSIRWKTRVHVLGEEPESRAIRRLQGEVRRSPRVRRLLAGHAELRPPTYDKWQGAHWVLASLADLGYPAGDKELRPVVDGVLETWLAPSYFRESESGSKAASYRTRAVPLIDGRYRRCGSQHGSALLSVVRLAPADDRAEQLVERLLHWQWPDGGWNCDRKAEASSSSVHETLLPMRGLSAYAAASGDAAAKDGARRAAEVLLDRRVLFRRSTGRVVHHDWAKLHYPAYWHYELLGALKGLAELGLVGDERCTDALDRLADARLPDGGWPAQARYYKGVGGDRPHFELVDWGGVDARAMNPWVTVDALAVLRAAGRDSAGG
ncbi:MAG TPA: hypothetical protein VEZ46_08620 [Mycobacteriales bacterium]|jgi:hypothetical protein|nr:hypothetical protein [Mycobacteriales bacterium]